MRPWFSRQNGRLGPDRTFPNLHPTHPASPSDCPIVWYLLAFLSSLIFFDFFPFGTEHVITGFNIYFIECFFLQMLTLYSHHRLTLNKNQVWVENYKIPLIIHHLTKSSWMSESAKQQWSVWIMTLHEFNQIPIGCQSKLF